ncbi:MAG: hypothetical protein KDA81_18640 [Planctomycetaceae bacterium]|nr:hypothetical protein [Planctomycetaceae bacterium]
MSDEEKEARENKPVETLADFMREGGVDFDRLGEIEEFEDGFFGHLKHRLTGARQDVAEEERQRRELAEDFLRLNENAPFKVDGLESIRLDAEQRELDALCKSVNFRAEQINEAVENYRRAIEDVIECFKRNAARAEYLRRIREAKTAGQ